MTHHVTRYTLTLITI